MSNFNSINIPVAPSAEELQTAQKQAEAAPKAPLQVSTGGGGRISFHGNDATVEAHEGAGTQRIEMKHRTPGRVTINGVETTREAAEAAGMIPDGEGEAADPDPARKAINSEKPHDGQPQKNSDGDAPPPEIQAASEILSKVAEAHGADLVDGALWSAAESGEVPVNLPPGMTAADAEAVADGYTTAAENILAEKGASVGLLNEMLTSDELAEARKATIFNDKGWLQNLGAKARDRLEALPYSDPTRFQQALAGLSPEDRKMVVQRNDEWILTLPAPFGEMSWAAAVRRGLLKY